MPYCKGNNEWVGVAVHKSCFYAHRGVNIKEISSQAAIQEKKSHNFKGCSVCLKHLDLCSGIGGFALGLQSTGYFKTIGFCEIDSFCQKVLKKNFPGVPIYSDIKKFKPNDEGLRPDIITAGFPCQPFSVAGKQQSKKDNRNLWKETFRVIKESKVPIFIGENVNGIVKLYLDTILEDLESANYSTRCFNISAQSIGASHQRKRIWIIANSKNIRSKHSFNGKSEKNRRRNELAQIFIKRNSFVSKKNYSKKYAPPILYEILMGYQTEWTELNLSETQSAHKSHSTSDKS